MTPKAAAEDEAPRRRRAPRQVDLCREGSSGAAAAPVDVVFSRIVNIEASNPVALGQNWPWPPTMSFQRCINRRLVGSGDSFNQAPAFDGDRRSCGRY